MPITLQPTVAVQHASALFSEVQITSNRSQFMPHAQQLSAVINAAGPHTQVPPAPRFKSYSAPQPASFDCFSTQALQAFAALQNGGGAAAAAELHRARAADGLMILGSAIVNAGALLRQVQSYYTPQSSSNLRHKPFSFLRQAPSSAADFDPPPAMQSVGAFCEPLAWWFQSQHVPQV